MRKNIWFWLALLLSLLQLGIYLIFLPKLPETIPLHWDIHGNPDRYGSKWEILLLACLPVLLSVLLFWLPNADPKKQSFQKHKKAYSITTGISIIVLSIINLFVLANLMGNNLPILELVFGLIGGLLIIIGNYMTQARQNFIFGIRTPWTLSSERVWRKTHRIGGYLFIICGGSFFLPIWIQTGWVRILPVLSIVVMVIVLFFYSYFQYRKENREK